MNNWNNDNVPTILHLWIKFDVIDNCILIFFLFFWVKFVNFVCYEKTLNTLNKKNELGIELSITLQLASKLF